MDEVEDSTFPDNTPGQSSFILLPSQDETQQESQLDKQMVKILKKLPALQNPDKLMQSEASDTCTDDENGRGKAVVLVSDTDSVVKTDVNNDPSDVASDSDWEEGVTVVHRNSGERTVEETQSDAKKENKSGGSHSSSNGSSFQSKNRSNLGSYDQCEVYKTQEAHVKGDRFDPFPASQDMFEESGKHDTGITSTPAEHIGSLHLSQNPMLVPETVDDTVNEIPPSPGVYGSTPMMVPSSPTSDNGSAGNQSSSLEDENQTVFDINAAQTLTSQVKDDYQENGDEGHVAESQHSEIDKAQSEVDLVSEDDKSESVQLNLSTGTLNIQNEGETKRKTHKAAVVLKDKHKPLAPGLRPPPTSQKLLGASQADIIVISSASASVMSEKEVADPDDFMLHLSMSDAGTTQGHRSQVADAKRSSQSSQRAPSESVENERAQKNPIRKPSQDDRTKDPKNDGSRSQESRSQESRSQESRSQGRGQSSGSEVRSQSRKKSKREKEIEKMNDNPLVEWRNESDTEKREEMSMKSVNRFSDEFHLAVPRDVGEPDVAMETGAETSQKIGVSQTAVTQPQAAQGESQFADVEDTGNHDKLSIQMIQSQSENTEPVFKLQKPEMEDEVLLLEETEDDYLRTVPRSKPNTRLIIEDSDDEAANHTGDTEKIINSDVDNTKKQQMFVATKLNPIEIQETYEDTQSYQAELGLETDVNGNAEKSEAVQTVYDTATQIDVNINAAEGTNKTVEEGTSLIVTEGTSQIPVEGTTQVGVERTSQTVVEGTNQVNEGGTSQAVRVRRQTESSTQTADGKVTEGFEGEINVVQKVAEYLQAGYTPRSRSSSTCTDLSDLHGDGSDKGDNIMKTPHRKDKMKTPSSRTRRESSDQRSPKSPHEIQNILKTYSHILSKSKQKHKAEDRSHSLSQRPNPSEPDLKKTGKLAPRRLSSQSLPEDLLGTKNPSRNTAVASDPWISARRPSAQPLLIESDNKSEHGSELNSPRKDVAVAMETRVTQELSENFRPENKHENSKIPDTEQNVRTEVLARSQSIGNKNTSSVLNENISKNKKERVKDNESLSLREKRSVSISDKHNENFAKNLPIVSLVKIDSPKAVLPDNIKQSKYDQPAGVENEILSQKSEMIAHTATKQKAINLEPTETIVIDSDITGSRNIHKINKNEPIDKNTEGSRLSLRSKDRKSNIPYYSKSTRSKKKIKRRLSAEKRNSLHRSTSTQGASNVTANTGVSPQAAVSGSFVESTQNFLPDQQGEGHDPYSFHGTQSQTSPNVEPAYKGQTPVSSRKRSKLQHKKTGLKKPKLDAEAAVNTSNGRPQVPFVTSPRRSSQSSDATVTTIGSLQSIPSSISQSSPLRETIVSPTSSSGRQSVSEEISTRLSGKRMSIEQALPDTLPLTHSEEDNYQRVTVVIEKVERVYREITTTRKVIGPQGQVIENTQDVKRLDPVIVEENTHKKIQYVYIPSPSRSVSSLTSGDLADVSSSLSRSSVSSSSVGSKIGSLSSSLDRNPGKHLETQTSLEHSHSDQSHGEASKAETSVEKPSSGEIMAAPTTVPRSKQSRISTDNQATTHEKVKQKETCDKTTSKEAIQQVTSPETPKTDETKVMVADKERQSKPVTPALHSDQENSDMQTPLGSTINKSSSYLHNRTSSVESPKVSESLFSTSSGDSKKQAANSGEGMKTGQSSDTSAQENRSSDQMSSEIPYQDQHVSSSQSSPADDQVAMVTSDGSIGSRVMAKWKDGFLYPGTLKSLSDRNGKHMVHFDDGSKLSAKGADILLIERLPLGQSVLVLTDEGDFESGLITKTGGDNYTVETDEGSSGKYTHSQVILSADQAECIVSDHGQDIILSHRTPSCASSKPGDVSLENLLDGPRRSVKKKPAATVAEVKVEDEGQGQSGKGRKRKHDTLKPQATSTPTPKGKSESVLTKRRKMLEDSPIAGIQSSPVPVSRTTRKTRIDLFGKCLGPIPSKKIFRNMSFLLTNVEKSKEQLEQEKRLIQDSSLDTSTDESATEEETSVPFDKEHLRRQIEAGGGNVIDNLDIKQVSSSKKRIVLLSSTYQRTIKYLQCLASGISCLSHMWVVDSSSQDRLLDEKSYVLPAGISLEKRKIMEWRKKNTVFQGIKAVVHSKNKTFIDSWTQILSLAGCKILSQLTYKDVHVIVTDNSCTASVEKGAESNNVNLVGTEWVIQCLVNGRLVSYNGHPRYKHDFLI